MNINITPFRNRPLRNRLTSAYILFGGLALLVCFVAPLIGPTQIDFRSAFDFTIPFEDNVDRQIFFIARLPRTIAGALVGAALASAGVVLQALLHNPLATPFTLGVSAGASLGALLIIITGLSIPTLGISAIPLASFAGALGAVSIVYGLARLRRQGLSTLVLLLAGVTLNAFFSAMIMFVQYFADYTQSFQAVRYLMGNLDVSSYEQIVWSLPLLLAAGIAFAWLPRSLNLLALGTKGAAARGVNVLTTQRIAFLSASLATGAAVSLGGPIGFVGIIVPHIVRLLLGSDYRVVIPASAFFGASFLVICDVSARTLMSPIELPVGVITAMLGGPFFLWLLVRHQ